MDEGYSLQRKIFAAILASMLLLSFSLLPLSIEGPQHGRSNTIQQGDLTVQNINTCKSYSTIQEAINDPETLDGHEISVGSGTYYEHVTINKSLSLTGEDPSTTTIDGEGMGKVVYILADKVEVRNLTIQSGTFGVWLHNSSNSKIIGNILQHGSYGLRLYYSPNAEIIENTIQDYSWFGVEIESSGNSTLQDNIILGNRYNFGVDGSNLSDFINNIDTSNTVNGKPIRYLLNQHNITIDSAFPEYGYLGLVNSTNIKIIGLDVQDNIQGILLAFTADSTINNVNAKENWNGIYTAHSTNTSASGNHANTNFDYGMKFFNSPHSIARENDVDNNGWAGIGVFKSPNSMIEGNKASFNTYDLHIVYTNNSIITRNNALIEPGASADYSIALYYSHNNLIYHNTLDSRLLYIEAQKGKPFTPKNSWDNGFEGNYWSTYRGVDADSDGIGDTPYIVGEDNIDNYPLMGKFSEHTATLEGRNYSVSIISNSTISHFQLEEGTISFVAAGESEAMGFSRIAMPNALLQQLPGSNLTFLINGRHPVLKKKWTDETNAYFYFSHISDASELTIGPWLIAATVASISLIVSIVAVFTSKKRPRRPQQTEN